MGSKLTFFIRFAAGSHTKKMSFTLVDNITVTLKLYNGELEYVYIYSF